MNNVAKHLMIGSVFALGLGMTPLMAQHGGQGHGPDEHGKAQHAALPRCPVVDEPVNLAVSMATDDGPVFFCCKGCIKKYKASPDKYAKIVTAQRMALASREKIQVTCPVSGNPVNQDTFVESNGEKVYFCCKDCAGEYKNNPSKYASALANSYTHQTTCPVMDEEINPQVFTKTASGNKIYFCCKGCDKKFAKNPKKYIPKLVAQGLTYEIEELATSKDDHAGHNH